MNVDRAVSSSGGRHSCRTSNAQVATKTPITMRLINARLGQMKNTAKHQKASYAIPAALLLNHARYGLRVKLQAEADRDNQQQG